MHEKRKGGYHARLRKCGPAALAGFALSTFSLSGCTTLRDYIHNGYKVGPNYSRPAAPVAPDWIDAGDQRVRKDSDDHRQWWAVFNDPVLNSFIGQSYLENLTLREAGFRILEARAYRGIQVGNLFPQTQQETGGFSRNGISVMAANRQFSPDRFFDQWQDGFNLAWELDFWGRFRRSVAAADANLDASIEDYDDVLVTLLADVATSYVQARTLQTRIVLARANAEIQRESLKIANAKFKGGDTTKIDVDQAMSDLATTESLIPALEISLRQTTNRLCILLGIPPRDLSKDLGDAPIPTAAPEVAVGIPAELLTRRPDIRRAERNAAAQCEQIGIAVADLYPHISVTGTIGLEAAQMPNFFNSKAMYGSVGPSYQWNILNYGRLINNVRLQDARFQELVTHYQQKVLTADGEVENGLIAFLKSQEQAKFLAESVDASADGLRLALINYREGKISFVFVARLQELLVQQQDNLAQAQGNIALGLIQVYKALGGGWQIRLADGTEPTPEKPPLREDKQLPELKPLEPIKP